MDPQTVLSPNEAAKLAEIRWEKKQDVYLAWSVDRATSLAIGWFGVGPRNGRQPRYAVRLGIVDGCALGGCNLFKPDDAALALACFLANAV